MSIDDFIDSVKTALASRGLATSEQAHFVLSYLEGPAKQELKPFEKTELDTREKIFDRLQRPLVRNGWFLSSSKRSMTPPKGWRDSALVATCPEGISVENPQEGTEVQLNRP